MYFDIESPIRVREFGKVTQPRGRWHNGRSIEFYLLIHLTSGNMKMQTPDGKYALLPGETLIIPPHTHYIPLESDGCTYYFIHFSADIACYQKKTLTVSLGALLPSGSYHYVYDNENGSVIEVAPLIKSDRNEQIEQIFASISRLEPHFNATHKLLIDNYLRELLILLSSELSKYKNMNRNFHRIVEYIKTSYNEDISLSGLATRFELSETYIARLFKHEFNLRPSDYVNRVRIEVAKDLLIHTERPITEIADNVGYSSLYYFSRVFKSIVGISPKEYRNENV